MPIKSSELAVDGYLHHSVLPCTWLSKSRMCAEAPRNFIDCRREGFSQCDSCILGDHPKPNESTGGG